MYFLIVCRLVFLFSLLRAVWQKTRSQNRRSPSKSIFFVYSYFVPAILFIFFTVFVPFGIPNESLHIAPPPHVRVTLKYISMYFLIVCRASLFILFKEPQSVPFGKKHDSQNRSMTYPKSIFFVFSTSYCACYPLIDFALANLCRLATSWYDVLSYIAPCPTCVSILKFFNLC